MSDLLEQLDRWMHVEGSKLLRLERNIVRYRIYQTVLFLYKVENAKKRLEGLYFQGEKNGAPSHQPEHLSGGQWKKCPPWRKALEQLLALGRLERKNIKEFVKLTTYRNSIAHDIEYLFADIGREKINREMRKFSFKGQKEFRYDYLDSLTACEDKISNAIGRGIMQEVGLRSLYFRSVETFIRQEMRRLESLIERQSRVRYDQQVRLSDEVYKDEGTWDWNGEFYPTHPDYKYGNGRLSPRGIKACYFLFEQKKSDLAIAYLMSLSVNSVKKRRKMWMLTTG